VGFFRFSRKKIARKAGKKMGAIFAASPQGKNRKSRKRKDLPQSGKKEGAKNICGFAAKKNTIQNFT